MNRLNHSTPVRLAVGLFAATVSIATASPPIPDPAYGGFDDGIARISATSVPADNAYAAHAVVQADGGVVMVGTASTGSGQQTAAQVVLVRFDAHGMPDSGFGPEHDGLYRSAFPGYGDDIARTADGGLVFTGHDSNFESILVGRTHDDGTPDTGFFGSGRRLIGPSALMDAATQGYFASVLPTAGGKTLALGFIVVPTPSRQYFSCAMRLLEDGSTDTSFGSDGRTCIAPAPSPGAASQALAGHVLVDGRVLLAGSSKHPGGSGWDMSVARLDADGVLDTSFGPAHDGWAFVGFDQGGTMIDTVQAIAVDGVGRILLAGFFEGVNGPDIGIARLLPDGQPDVSFGTQGRVQIALDLGGFNDDRAHSIAVLPDGGILVGGAADTNGSRTVGVAIQLTGDGLLVPGFGEGGVFLQADPTAPQTAKIESAQQILAGDYLYMLGDAVNTSNRLDFAATRTVLPLFADGFDN